MIFFTRREFDEAVERRVNDILSHRENEDRYWKLVCRIDELEKKSRKMEETTEVKIKEGLIPLDNAFMEHG